MSFNSIWQTNTAVCGPQFALYGDAFGDGHSIDTTLMVAFSVVQGGLAGVYVNEPSGANLANVYWGAGNTAADAVFVRAPNPGPDGVWGTADDDPGDLHLLPGSPCIDAGDPAYVPAPGETDIDGDPRVLDGNGDGIAVIDIGADEFAP